MSADNTVVILQTVSLHNTAEYRVAHVQNAEMLGYSHELQARDEYIRSYFGKSVVYRSEKAALKEARRVYDSYSYVEYGITVVKLDTTYPAAPDGTPAATKPRNSKKRSRKRRSAASRIAALTAKIHDLESRLQRAENALEQSRAGKEDLMDTLKQVLTAHA